MILYTGYLGGIGNMGRIAVELRLECQTGSTLRDVQPETQGSCIHAVCNITEYTYIAHIEQDVVSPAAERGVRVVEGNAQCIVTVLYLTVLSGCQEGMCVIFRAELTGQRISTNQGVVNTVGNTPCLCVREAHPIRDIAVFEVPTGNNFRALTEAQHIINRCQSIRVLVSRSQLGTGLGLIGGCGISQSIFVPGTYGIIGECPGKGICLIVDIPVIITILNDGIQGNLLAVGNDRAVSTETEGIGMHDVDGVSESLTVYGELYLNLTQLAIGYEDAVGDGTEGIVGQRPCTACGHCHHSTGGINCFCGKGIGGVGCKVVVLGVDVCAAEGTGGHALCLCNKDCIQSSTLGTVRRSRTHGQGGFTRTLRNEGGRTAAVTVECIYAAQCQHQFAHFVVTLTNRVVSATAVGLAENQRAVCLNTNHGTGCSSGGTLFSLGNQSAVLDQPAKVCTDTVPVICFKGFILAAQFHSAILLNGDVGGAGTLVLIQPSMTQIKRVIDILQHLAFPHQEGVGSIAVVCQSGVHTTDNVIAQSVLVVCCHIGDLAVLLICLVGGIGSILVNLIVAGNQLNGGAHGIDGEESECLTAGTGSIVHNDLSFGNTCNDVVFLFGKNIVIATGCGGVKAACLDSSHHGGSHLLLDCHVVLSEVVQQVCVDLCLFFIGQCFIGFHGTFEVGTESNHFLCGSSSYQSLQEYGQFAFVFMVVVSLDRFHLSQNILQLSRSFLFFNSFFYYGFRQFVLCRNHCLIRDFICKYVHRKNCKNHHKCKHQGYCTFKK